MNSNILVTKNKQANKQTISVYVYIIYIYIYIYILSFKTVNAFGIQERISCWIKMRRTFAYVKKFIRRLRQKIKNRLFN